MAGSDGRDASKAGEPIIAQVKQVATMAAATMMVTRELLRILHKSEKREERERREERAKDTERAGDREWLARDEVMMVEVVLCQKKKTLLLSSQRKVFALAGNSNTNVNFFYFLVLKLFYSTCVFVY